MLINLEYENGDYDILDFSKTPIPFEVPKNNEFRYVGFVDLDYFSRTIDSKEHFMSNYYNQKWVSFCFEKLNSQQRASRLLRRKVICL